MSDPFSLVVASAALAGAISSVSATLIQVFKSRQDRKRKLREAESIRLGDVLQINELEDLGQFLDMTIGKFNVAEYTENRTVAKTIDRYLDGVVDFLGTEEEVPDLKSVPPEHSQFDFHFVPHHAATNAALAKVISELEDGEIWNALARLRREIEIFLRSIATKQGFKEQHLKGAGQMIRLLAEREYLPRDVAEQLASSVSICNRAVHGREVSINEAREAYLIAGRVLDEFAA